MNFQAVINSVQSRKGLSEQDVLLSIVYWHLRTKDEVSCENCFSMIPRDISIISKFLKFKLLTTMKSAKRNLDAFEIVEVECLEL